MYAYNHQRNTQLCRISADVTGFEGDQQGNANAVGVGAPGDETADAENDAIADGAELLRQLHERITQDEEIAVKSALLLKLLEVSSSSQELRTHFIGLCNTV